MKLDKQRLLDLVLLIAGNFVLAVSTAFFILPNSILTGGVAGVAVVVTKITDIPSNVIISILYVGLFIMGLIFLGKEFAVFTAVSSILYPIFLNILTCISVEDVVIHNDILASLFGGLLQGLGVGLVFKTKASTGGMDVIPLVLHKYSRLPIASLVLVTDSLTVLFGFLVFGLEPTLIGLISVIVGSIMINKAIMFGTISSHQVLIISDETIKIKEKINIELSRGTTIFDAIGGYTNNQKKVILTVISKREFPLLQNLVANIDPEAFMVSTQANEVYGYGFSFDEKNNIAQSNVENTQ